MSYDWARHEAETAQLVADFTKGWSWDLVFSVWSCRLQELNVCLKPLFKSIEVHDPGYPAGRRSHVEWCPVEKLADLPRTRQQWFDAHPKRVEPQHYRYARWGEAETLQYLLEAQTDIQKIAAILIAGSLFARMGSSRNQYPVKQWPRYPEVKALLDWAHVVWFGPDGATGWPEHAWPMACTQVLPYCSPDYNCHIKDMAALVRYLAEEHAIGLQQHPPVITTYVARRAPELQKEFEAKKAQAAQNYANWEIKRIADDAAHEIEIARLRQTHPRWGEWGSISGTELTRLVWTKATSQLAQDFGVSDVAIGNRCKVLGISKPPLGFWRQVEAGRIPHPDGKPVTKASIQRPSVKRKPIVAKIPVRSTVKFTPMDRKPGESHAQARLRSLKAKP